MKRIISLLSIILLVGFCHAAEPDYQNSKEYQALRDSMHHAFNAGDSARFFPALKNLQDYLLKQNDLHAYYTQRCNEIDKLTDFAADKGIIELSGDIDTRKAIEERLRRFVDFVMPTPPPPALAARGAEAMRYPLDLMLLSL